MTPSLKQRVKESQKCCQFCGSVDNLTVDHIVPLIEGGTDSLYNLQTLCNDCNQRKGPVPPMRYRIVNLFNGNLYWFKRQVRDTVSTMGLHVRQSKDNLEKFKQSLEDKLRDKFKSIDIAWQNQSATNGIYLKRFSDLEFQNINLVARVEALELAVATLASADVKKLARRSVRKKKEDNFI